MATDNSKPTATPTTSTATVQPSTATAQPVQPSTATVQPVQPTNAPQQPVNSSKPDTISMNEAQKPTPENNTVKDTVQPEAPAPETAKPVAPTETSNKITAESLKGLTVEQLNALQVQGIHNADENKAIEDAKKQAGDGDENFAESKDGEQPQGKERDDKGPFKEGDIIKYMYEDWLIGGANWLWNKSAEKLDKGYFRMKNAIAQAKREEIKKEEAQGKKVETKKAHNEIESYYSTKVNNNSAFLGEHNTKMQENIAKAKEGKLEETTFDEQTKKLLMSLPEDKRKDFCKYLSKSMDNLHNNLTNIEQSSAMITKAQMAAELCQDPKAFDGKNKDELFDAYQKKNKTLLCKRLDQEIAAGRDPTKLMNETLKLAKNASEQADENIAKGKYAEYGNAPGKNKYLDEINKSLSVSAAPTTQNNEPKGIYEQFNEDNNVEKAMQTQLGQSKQGLGETANRRANNEARQDKLVDMYTRIAAKDPSKAAEMNRRIANLQAIGPESGVVKNDQTAKSKIAQNSTQLKMSEMLGANR